jgi:hypothetical protein
MGPKPRGDFSLDRIDPTNPMYGPGLCEWRDKKHQSRNRNNVHLLTDRDGTTMTLPAWAEVTGQNANTLRKRKSRRWQDTWVIHGRPKRAAPVAPSTVPAGDPVDALPYPVISRRPTEISDRDLKLMWEREYRQFAKAGERRLEFFIRQCREVRRKAIEQIPEPPDDPYDIPMYDEAVARHPQITAAMETEIKMSRYIDEARKLLAVALEREREREEERRRVQEARQRNKRALRQPGHFGKTAEEKLDAIAFGYDPDLVPSPNVVGSVRDEVDRPVSWDEWDGWEDLEGEVSDEDGD